jgi:hypothetical protein
MDFFWGNNFFFQIKCAPFFLGTREDLDIDDEKNNMN